MNVFNNLDNYKIPNIDKITKIPGIEEIESNNGKLYSITYFLFINKNGKYPITIRINSKTKNFNSPFSIDICNQRLKPAVMIELRPDTPEDKFIDIISKIPQATKFQKSGLNEYLENLKEISGSNAFQIARLVYSGVIIFFAVFFTLRYWFVRVSNWHEEKQAAGKLEQEMNRKLFVGQKKNEPAFKMYANLENFIKFVALGKAPAVILCGPPGMSKTYIVKRTFYFEKLRPGVDYNIEKGSTLSTTATYDLLYENKDRILVLDDFDTPLRNEDTVNMLKAITDSYDKRILSFPTEKTISQGENQEVSQAPRKFEYRGKLIIITNLKKSQIDRALLSRAPAFEVNFSTKEVLDSLDQLINFVNPEVSIESKKEVLNYILKLYKKNKNIEVTYRSFKCAIDARVGNPDYWKEMVHTIVGLD